MISYLKTSKVHPSYDTQSEWWFDKGKRKSCRLVAYRLYDYVFIWKATHEKVRNLVVYLEYPLTHKWNLKYAEISKNTVS